MHPDLLNDKARNINPHKGSSERWPDAQKNMIDSFYRTVLYGDAPRFADFREGHKVVKIVEAILESDKRRAWQQVS